MRLALVTMFAAATLGATGYTSLRSGNWSDPALWSPVGVPRNGDTANIANGHAVTVDADAAVGTSAAGYYSYFSSAAVAQGGAGYTGTCSIVVSGGTPNSTAQGFSCTFSGGALASVTLTVPRQLYAPASVMPELTIKCSGGACSPSTPATINPVWVQGGGMAAIHLNASGKLVLGAGKTLTVKGSILYTSGSSNTSDAVVWSAGSRLIFDPSGAGALSDGTRPIYSFGPDGLHGYRHAIATTCTLAEPCTLSSTGVAQLGNGFGRGQGVHLNHVNVSNMGDGVSPWLFADAYYSSVTVDVQDSRFTNCGMLWGTAWWQTDSVFRFSGNTMSGTRAPFSMKANFLNAIGTGTRNISRNVFDKPLHDGAGLGMARDATMEDNFFGNGLNVISTSPWASFRRNFVRTTWTYGVTQGIPGDMYDSYFLLDEFWQNPHVLAHVNSTPVTFDGLIFGYSDQAATDSGEIMGLTGGSPASPTNHYYKNIIALPDAEGYSWAEMLSLVNTNWLVNLTHSIWFGGWKWGGFGMVQINEMLIAPSNEIQAIKSNIVFNPYVAGYVPGGTQGFLKVNTAQTTGLNVDVAAPDSLDYNAGWNNAGTQANCTAGCQNQGNGYGGAWSSTPGQHDISADPRLADFQRSVELFDSKYLRNAYGQWAAATGYQAGDFVTVSDPDVYWGLPVNYRCIAAHTADAGNKPGTGAWTEANGLLSSLTVAANVATVVTTAPHGLAAGESIGIYSNCCNGLLAKTYTVASVPDANTFTVATSGAANGTYTSTSTVKPWRKYWEWASLYRLRENLGAEYRVFPLDGAIAPAMPSTCTPENNNILCVLEAWVRRGYTPQELRLYHAGHDGGDIGAVPMDTPAAAEPIQF